MIVAVILRSSREHFNSRPAPKANVAVTIQREFTRYERRCECNLGSTYRDFARWCPSASCNPCKPRWSSDVILNPTMMIILGDGDLLDERDAG
jgi:hypothetical protein